ncbi:MAG TPA: hypothetical protein VIB00_18410 [Pyrinomonadaceae bacterium]
MRKIISRTAIVLLALGVIFIAGFLMLHHRRARAVTRSLYTKADPPNTQANPGYEIPRKLADLKDPAIKESSGIVASRSNPGLYWTHNDSGDGPFLYAFDERGQRRGVWQVAGAKARDWESIAAGPGPDHAKHYLYVGDIGDNSGKREEIAVYRVVEPVAAASQTQTTKKQPANTENADVIRLRYPNEKHNAEALLVHPRTGDLYIVTKETLATPHVYRASAPFKNGDLVTLKFVGPLSIPSMLGGIVTDGAISPDGKRVVICDYLRGYELVLQKSATNFDSIWKEPMTAITLGERKQGEAITYRLDGRALLVTSEGSPAPLIEIVRR